jgi:hypothetical protein
MWASLILLRHGVPVQMAFQEERERRASGDTVRSQPLGFHKAGLLACAPKKTQTTSLTLEVTSFLLNIHEFRILISVSFELKSL